MATVEITNSNLGDVVKSNKVVVLDFWAEWCGPCKQFGPVFERASDKHDGAVFGKVDIDKENSIAMSFNIQAVPTVAVIVDGELVLSQAGALTAPALEKIVEAAQKM
jgi:thioredoxin 1